MKMCDKEIGFLDAKLFKGTLQRLLTLRAVEAGINELTEQQIEALSRLIDTMKTKPAV